MNKATLITWIASLSEDDPDLRILERIRNHEPPVTILGRTFTITESARIAHVSRQTANAAIGAGALLASPLYRGGRRRVREVDLAAWLKGRSA